MTTPRMAIATTGIVAVFSIILLAMATIPSTSSTSSINAISGDVVLTNFQEVIVKQYDITPYDYNMDGFLEFNDFNNIMDGRVACLKGKICDINQDGYLDKADEKIFDSVVRSLYDYDRNGRLDKEDLKQLLLVMNDKAEQKDYYVYDLNHDGKIDKTDVSLLTGIIYG